MDLHNDNSNQQAVDWSRRLGTLAAENASSPTDFSNRLAALLRSIRKQNKARSDMDKFRAGHFILAR
jgi:hypothetical protein